MIFHKIFNTISKLIPIKIVTNNTNPILLYHSIFNEVPEELKDGLDNITTTILFKQLSELKKNYTVVTVDEYFKLKDKKGYACVTFDDAYQNVIKNGLSIFEELDIPVTIFVNSSTLENKVFWRDKVRYILNNNLVLEFEELTNKVNKVKGEDFYKYSKMNLNNSILVESEINSFLKSKNLKSKVENYCINSKEQLIKHKLISYGNHSHNHYVLSSLTYDEQYQEILQTKTFLDKLEIKKINLFSLPFGGNDDYNEDTITIIKKLGYDGILMSRNRINYLSTKNNFFLERFMPFDKPIYQILKKLFLKKIIGK